MTQDLSSLKQIPQFIRIRCATMTKWYRWSFVAGHWTSPHSHQTWSQFLDIGPLELVFCFDVSTKERQCQNTVGNANPWDQCKTPHEQCMDIWKLLIWPGAAPIAYSVTPTTPPPSEVLLEELERQNTPHLIPRFPNPTILSFRNVLPSGDWIQRFGQQKTQDPYSLFEELLSGVAESLNVQLMVQTIHSLQEKSKVFLLETPAARIFPYRITKPLAIHKSKTQEILRFGLKRSLIESPPGCGKWGIG